MKDKFEIDTNILYCIKEKDSKKQEKALNFLKKARNKEAALPLRALSECYNLSLHRNNIEAEKSLRICSQPKTRFSL